MSILKGISEQHVKNEIQIKGKVIAIPKYNQLIIRDENKDRLYFVSLESRLPAAKGNLQNTATKAKRRAYKICFKKQANLIGTIQKSSDKVIKVRANDLLCDGKSYTGKIIES
jgi:hypothetical protein